MKQAVSFLIKFISVIALLFSIEYAFADTPSSGTVKARSFSGDGNTAIGATGTSLNVNVTNTTGLTTVNQGSAGASAWPVSLATQPLPTGAATETSLLGVNTNLTAVLTKLPTLVGGNMPVSIQNSSIAVTGSLGRTWSLLNTTDSVNVGNFPSSFQVSNFPATQPVSGSVSVSNFPGTQVVSGPLTDAQLRASAVPVSGTITASNSANGATGSAVPAQATQVAGSDGTSLRALKVSATGVVAVDGSAVTQPVSAASLPLPSGASTSALQTTGNTSLSSIDTKTPALVTGRVPVDGSAVTQPISAAALPLPSGAATAANQSTGNASLSSIDTKVPALGQALAAASVPVVLPAAQVTALTPPTTVAVTQATGTNLHTVVDSGSVTATIAGTPNVAVTSSALPTGAATAANQATEISSLSSIDSKLTSPLTVTQTSQPLPTGAATSANQSTMQTTLGTIATNTTGAATAANQSTEITSLASIVTNTAAIDAGIPAALGQTTMTASMPVTIASNQSALAVSGSLTSAGTVSTVASVTSSNSAAPLSVADVASAALTTTTTTAAFTPSAGVGYVISLPVTAVSGTTPTLITQVQESADAGTNWVTVYTFPTVTATGFWVSPPLMFKGNRVRYVQTVAGTTPSFTRAINRLQMSAVATTPVNNNATFANGSVSAVTTLTAPTNAVGFVLQNLNTNTTSLRYAIGATASSTVGMQLEPGRDSGEIHAGQNISICPESGTIAYSIQWVQQ